MHVEMVGSSLDLKDVYQVTTHRPQKYYYSLGNTNQLAPLDMQDVTDIQLAPKRVYLKEHNTCMFITSTITIGMHMKLAFFNVCLQYTPRFIRS